MAARYNIEIEETAVSDEVKQQIQIADSLYIINAFAQKHFSHNLLHTEEGQSVALSYLQHRGFNTEIIEKFQLGYNLEVKDDLTAALVKNQYNIDYAQRAGLVAIRNEMPVDNYRGRIIFPIHNQSGKIIGFGARIIKSNDKAPKYINTPENEIYVKSKILYGTYFARQAINKYDECLLVEGYTDVVSLHQAGIENVVASGGTSLTIDQLRLIRKHTNNLTIIYDGDSAGVKAALRGLDMALEEGLNVKLVLIPDNEDPDSYVKKIGASPFREFVNANKTDFILFQLEVMLKDAGNDTAKKATVVNHVAETLSRFSKVEDFTKQQDYVRQCSAILKIDETGLTTLVNKYKRDRLTKEENRQQQQKEPLDVPEKAQEETDTISLFINDEFQEKNLLRVLLEYGLKQWNDDQTIADYLLEELQQFDIENAPLNELLTVYRDQYYKGIQPTMQTLLYHENGSVRNLVVNLSVQQYELSPNWDKIMEGMHINNRDISRQDVTMSLNYFKLRKLKKMFDENQRDIEKATSFEEQMKLIGIHKILKQEEQKITSLLGTVIFK